MKKVDIKTTEIDLQELNGEIVKSIVIDEQSTIIRFRSGRSISVISMFNERMQKIIAKEDCKIKEDKIKTWRDENGKLHRDNNLPAVIYPDGSQHWFKHGNFHRENNLPAIVSFDGSKEWIVNGKLHRLNGPAIDKINGHKEYWINGVHLTEDEFKEIINS